MRAIPSRPQVKPWYRIAEDDNGVLFEYGGSVLRFSGEAAARLLPVLLPLLDGTRTLTEITDVVGKPVEPAVRNTLDLLAEHGIVADQAELECDAAQPVRETAEFLAASVRPSLPPPSVLAELAGARIAIVGSSCLSTELARLLRSSGLQGTTCEPVPSETDLAGRDLLVAAPSPTELPILRDLNQLTLLAATPWLQILPHDGRLAVVGPLYLPGETCCYECFTRRRAANLDYPDEFWALHDTAAPYPSPPMVTSVLAGLASSVALRWVALRDPQLPGVLFALEQQETIRLTQHYVYRVPRCPVCSDARDLAPPQPWFESEKRDAC